MCGDNVMRHNSSYAGVVQLAPAGDSSGGTLRWAQRQVTASTRGAYLATTIDLYDATSPCGSVHIRNKTAVGERLAAGTLAMMDSPENATVARRCGPEPIEIVRSPTGSTLRFSESLQLMSVSGMTVAGAHHCNFETTTIPRPSASNASAGTAWGGWEAVASATLEGRDRVTLGTHTTTGHVRGIRYAWGDVPSNDSQVANLNGQFLYSAATGSPCGVFIAVCDGDGRLGDEEDVGGCRLLEDDATLNPMRRNRTV